MQFSSFAESPADPPQNTKSETILSGIVTDVVTKQPVAGLNVSIDGKSCLTNEQGFYKITGLHSGTSRLDVTGNSIITRSMMVAHEDRTTLDITVKMSDFNNNMFWASAGKSERVMRWQKPPKWVIYTHILDSHPPQEFAPRDRQYLFDIIRKELPLISPFFNDPEIELFKGRPNDDPRWSGKGPAEGFILCAPDTKGGGNTHWYKSWWWISCAKIKTNYGRSAKVWRHEIAHALGMAHAFDNEKWLPLGVKDPNYRQTKLHDGVNFSDWDKLWLHCVYSGCRPAGNYPPDCDPAKFVHGKDKI